MATAFFDRNQRIKNRLDRQYNRIIKNDLKFGISRFKLQSVENDIRKLEQEKNENKEKRKLYSRIANVMIVIAAAFFDIVLCQDAAPKLTERVAWFPASQITIPVIIVIIEMCLANFVLQSIFQENQENNNRSWKNLLTNGERIKYIINITLTALFIIGLPLLSYTTYLDEIGVHGLKTNAIRELSVRYTVILGFSLISHIVIALNYRKILQSFRELKKNISDYLMGNTIIKKKKKFNRLKKESTELLRKNLEEAVEFVREVSAIQDNNPINPETQQPANPSQPSYVLPHFPRELSYAVVNYFGYQIIPMPPTSLQPLLYRDPMRIFETLLSKNERGEVIADDTQRKEHENQLLLKGIQTDQETIRRQGEILERERGQQEQENGPVDDLNEDGNQPQAEEEVIPEQDSPREDDYIELFGRGE